MSGLSPLWISEAAVVSNMDIGDAITALKKALLAEARGEAKNMMKTHVAWDSSTLHAIGAVFPNEGFAGTKTWAHTPGGATPLLILLDSESATLMAIIQSLPLRQSRTVSASLVAATSLAENDADEVTM